MRRRIREIENNKDATAVEQDLMTTLEVCYEFCLRGFHFEPIDIYRSDATKFIVTENGLLPPFTSVRGLGETAALDTVEKRKGKTFTSVEEFSMCCNKLSQTHIDQLRALGAFAGLPETSQLTLFWCVRQQKHMKRDILSCERMSLFCRFLPRRCSLI